MKPNEVKIIHIIAKDNHVLGLGDDGMVYEWLSDSHTWRLWD